MAPQKRQRTTGLWRPDEGGYETTTSPVIITNALARIKKTRGYIAILHKGYQSGNTIVVNFNEQHLLLDKPRDWPGNTTRIRVVFKDEFQVWNHFMVAVLAAKNDTLKTTFPTELFRLQRRSNYRIVTPTGSTASFTLHDKTINNADLINLSVGGVMLTLDNRGPLLQGKPDATISDITMWIYNSQGDGPGEDHQLTVKKGRVVRELLDKERNCLQVGVQFSTASIEEKQLLRYIRQRELEVLRKGIKD